MTPYNENPTSPSGGAGLPNIVQLGGFERVKQTRGRDQDNRGKQRVQGSGSAPLFRARTRDDALHTANEFNAAARRCRDAAREHPGATGLTLDRLAVHYTRQAREWFGRAETLPGVPA